MLRRFRIECPYDLPALHAHDVVAIRVGGGDVACENHERAPLGGPCLARDAEVVRPLVLVREHQNVVEVAVRPLIGLRNAQSR